MSDLPEIFPSTKGGVTDRILCAVSVPGDFSLMCALTPGHIGSCRFVDRDTWYAARDLEIKRFEAWAEMYGYTKPDSEPVAEP